ncbi:penicillin-binding transpeptidase domain-containing protein [Raineyella antarctica]|uniref:penicillin-binding transpeptidase domain-containing protein n=1 Tax=Raineyella antarctica TaxID=1577474 RepID=UPI001114BF7F|nr:penicillin-binding transpeptidase domain-containing protein [Raineyella antarctica]
MTPRVRSLLATALTLALLSTTTACSALATSRLRALVGALETGLESGDLGAVRVTDGFDATADLRAITSGMDGIRPQVSTGAVAIDGQHATVPLTFEWTFPAGPWRYDTTAGFSRGQQGWAVDWSPTLVHPSLSATTRLVHRRTPAERGQILGKGGTPIVRARDTFTLGLDKSTIPATQVDDSAGRIARALGIDEARYRQRVRAAGPIAYVEALTVRAERTQVAPAFLDTPGARIIEGQRQLGPTPTFAQGLLGTVGPADAARARASGGAVAEGDLVGLGGLQERYDAQLRGVPGDRVVVVPRDAPAGTVSNPPAVFNATPTPGVALETTLDEAAQTRAEQVLAGVSGSAALVALDTATGAVLAAATSPADGARPTATSGRFPPGSTFKVATTLALLRSGLTPESEVACSPTETVDGRTFTNYSDFPSSGLGRTTLRSAVALSCNTALVSERERITPEQLTEAAGSLGLGRDHDAGFPAFYGSVPPPANPVGAAEAMIGQGLVEASPLSMAGVAASVAAGRTTVPYLLERHRPTPDAAPLTAQEAAALQSVMQATVQQGSASSLKGVLTGAKTGTAEYGTQTPPRTHAWMIGYRDGVAVAAFVADGASGSSAAGPLVRAYLG